MSILVIAEPADHVSAATRAVLGAAKQLGGEVHLLVLGGDANAHAALESVGKVLHASDPSVKDALAENVAPLIAKLAPNYSHVLMAATTTGRDIMPRAAALCDATQISDIIGVVDATTFRRPIYAGNAIETVQTNEKIIFLTIRPTAFDKVADGGSAAIETVQGAGDSGLSRFIDQQGTVSERPELASARVVISGGRGLGSKENFALLDSIADKLGAAIGASRAAVDAGYVPNDMQVGQTGKVVAPELYIAVGISGAIQHLAGMKESKVIVAINKDENAPIFDIADYGLVGDLFQILPELEKSI